MPVTEVFANHYGASNLRGELKTIAENTSYFTAAEQDLMNNTTVTTKDTKNRNNYTTTDKLYALAADDYRSSTIKAGSYNSTVLATSNYWNSGDAFWLRSPRDGFADAALLTSSGSWVNGKEVYDYGCCSACFQSGSVTCSLRICCKSSITLYIRGSQDQLRQGNDLKTGWNRKGYWYSNI